MITINQIGNNKNYKIDSKKEYNIEDWEYNIEDCIAN